MSLPRFFVDPIPPAGSALRLPREEAAHAKARRLAAGNPVVLFDGRGAEAAARVARVSRAGVEVTVENRRPAAEGGPELALYVAAMRLERLAWIVEKATELGATRVVLLETRRTQAFRAASHALARLERVARAAAKQCGAPRAPVLSGPVTAASALAGETAPNRFLLDPSGIPFPVSFEPASAVLAVGPEGGWVPEEVTCGRDHGWIVTRLPGGILRGETAAITALALAAAAVERGRERRTSV